MAKKYIDAERLIEYLEKEADKEFKATEENANSPVICHFHNGCRMQALDTIDFIKQLQQEQPSEDLEEAAENQANTLEELIEYLSKRFDVSYAKLARIVVKTANWQKQQMLKDAMEGIAHPDDCEIWVNLVGYGYKFNDGDKVKIIIVKEDKK